ncbi:MAG: NUDIX domain-containing protein [Candidatus Liptonbacteria bacterium]|nr:NUDIX domain-containing protein [Candidatus Liptonbacteria bacterium]
MDKVDRIFVATKAFLERDGKILVLRESNVYADGTNAGRWDVPGGRVEPGQRFDESLKREVLEETGLTAEVGEPFYVGEWRPEVRGEKWQIVGVYFRCRAGDGEVKLGQDHDEFRWISPSEATDLNLIDNVRPAVAAYLKSGALFENQGGCHSRESGNPGFSGSWIPGQARDDREG